MLLNCFLTKFRRKFVISATQLRASDSKEGLCHLFAALTEGLTEGIIHHVSTTIMQSRSKFGCLASLIYNLKDITLGSLWACRGFKDSKSFIHVYMRWNEITCTQSQKSRKTVSFFPDENAGKVSTLSQQFIKKSNSPCSLCDYDCIILSE